MSFKTTPTQMKSIIFASQIKTSDFILDYLNGKGEFYIQNKYFPISSIPADKKTSFEDIDFNSPNNGCCYHAPSIFYNYQGTYNNRFVIGWGDPTIENEWWIGNPFKGYDLTIKKPVSIIEWGTSKIKTINIPITRSVLTDYDQELIKLSFHLNEAFSILLFASIFKIDLAKYSSFTNNSDFYKQFIDDINEILKKLKFTELIQYISTESLDNYNKLIYTIKDPMSSESKTAYGYKSGDSYLVIDTIRGVFNECVTNKKNITSLSNLTSFNPKMKDIIDKLKSPGELLKNKFSYQVYEKRNPTDGTSEFKLSTKLAADFTLLNPSLSITDKCSVMCSQYARGDNFVPVNSEDLLMKYYHKKVTGLIFFSLSFTFGMYKIPSIGLGFKVSRFDLEEMAAVNNQVNQDIMSFIQSRRKTVSTNESLESVNPIECEQESNYNGEDIDINGI